VIIHVAQRLHTDDLAGHILEHAPGCPIHCPQGRKISRLKRKKP
jgi:hypothetical protein